MKYFGTDGIRGEIKKYLSDKIIDKTAKAIVLYYQKHKFKKVLLVGNDTRSSSDYILSKISTRLLQNGIEIHNLGCCSSPCLAYLTQKYNYPLGLMLSASHNSAEYNGLKFFNTSGEKTDDVFEEELESLMDKKITLKNKCFAKLKNIESIKQTYIEHLKNHKKFTFPCILDCANGGTSHICKTIFTNAEKINITPSGTNINENAGCTHIEMLQSLCRKKQKIGFAFDGDGDRIHVVDIDGTIITGDKILYILSKFYQRSGDICVGTIYTNTGLEKALNQRKITLKRVAVGDKNVYQYMKKGGCLLGGEDSGHIILNPFMNTGDGVLIAILLANALELSKKTLKDLLDEYKEYYQVRENLKLENLSIPLTEILENKYLKNTIKYHENQGAKIIIRPSGTEPLLRIFVEHENENFATKVLNETSVIIKDLIIQYI